MLVRIPLGPALRSTVFCPPHPNGFGWRTIPLHRTDLLVVAPERLLRGMERDLRLCQCNSLGSA